MTYQQECILLTIIKYSKQDKTMKKILLILLVSLGLQTQAQITCDSITTNYLSITQDTIKLETNSTNLGIPFAMHSWDLYEGCQNGILTYSDTNVLASIPLPSPNLVDTFVLCNWSDYGSAPYSCYSCDTFAWNNGNWNLLSMMQQPYFCCDSISYWTDQGQGLFVGLDTSGIIHNPDSMTVSWSVCNANMCYVGDGIDAYFGQIVTTDTIKVGYDVYIYENGVLEICSIEEWLIFDQNTYTWILYNMNTVGINELQFTWEDDGIIYDLMGRKLVEVNVGQMYIRNNKKYIRIK